MIRNCHLRVCSVGPHHTSSSSSVAAAPKAISGRARYGASSCRPRAASLALPVSQTPMRATMPTPMIVHAPSASRLREDLPGVLHGRFDALGPAERVDDDTSPRPCARRRIKKPTTSSRDRQRAEDRAAAAGREPDRGGADEEREQPHDRADHLQQLRDVLRRLELARLHDLNAARVGRQRVGDAPEDGDPVAELDHERAQVEDDEARPRC